MNYLFGSGWYKSGMDFSISLFGCQLGKKAERTTVLYKIAQLSMRASKFYWQ
jgi:hypothetical protein